jgi:hypothetical protein
MITLSKCHKKLEETFERKFFLFFGCTLFLFSCFRLDEGNRNRRLLCAGLFGTSRLGLFGSVLNKNDLAILPPYERNKK